MHFPDNALRYFSDFIFFSEVSYSNFLNSFKHKPLLNNLLTQPFQYIIIAVSDDEEILETLKNKERKQKNI